MNEELAEAEEIEETEQADDNVEASVEAPIPNKPKVHKENTMKNRTRSRGADSLPKAILKRKKSTNYWLWAGPAGMCQLAQAIKGDVDDLLKGVVDKNVVEEVKHILEMARRVSSRRDVVHTDFLTPPVLKDSMIALEKLADVKTVAQGGYPQETSDFNLVLMVTSLAQFLAPGLRGKSLEISSCSNGDVRVNWNTVTKNGTTLKTGDIVSVSGKGRLKIGEINRTKKGKFAVELVLYL
ncbi:hypothetical protein LWI29_017836 [Acer saccharum]|uniref:RNA-binding S4 domain-containing protein n=1 Tax=Acer saccharum TaxID=4024 RepID=A0AA39SLR3_ACESA|nr:hypothetical protein LWI29_017836 [Acer saccharum]